MKKLSINKNAVKSNALFFYVALTLLGAYSAAMVYAGMQLTGTSMAAQAVSVAHYQATNQSVQPSK